MPLLLKWLSILVAFPAVFLAIYWQLVSTPVTTVTEYSPRTNFKQVDVNFPVEDSPLQSEEEEEQGDKMAEAKTIYDFKYVDIDGEEQSMEKYRSCFDCGECGEQVWIYMCQLPTLTELYDKYKDSEGLRILAFPCNQFGGQEPLGEKEIKEFCKEYNVTYDMASKINVNGDDTHPLWTFLKDKQRGILGTTLVKWNFTKFLVDKQGKVLNRYAPNTNPKSMEKDIINAFST